MDMNEVSIHVSYIFGINKILERGELDLREGRPYRRPHQEPER